jgi:hypothetical protein
LFLAIVAAINFKSYPARSRRARVFELTLNYGNSTFRFFAPSIISTCVRGVG